MTYYEESKNMFQNYQDTWDYYKMHNNTIIDVLPNRENILLLRQDQLIRKTSQFLSLSKRKCGLSKQVAFSLGFQCSESAKPPLRNFLPLARLRIYGANAPPPMWASVRSVFLSTQSTSEQSSLCSDIFYSCSGQERHFFPCRSQFRITCSDLFYLLEHVHAPVRFSIQQFRQTGQGLRQSGRLDPRVADH